MQQMAPSSWLSPVHHSTTAAAFGRRNDEVMIKITPVGSQWPALAMLAARSSSAAAPMGVRVQSIPPFPLHTVARSRRYNAARPLTAYAAYVHGTRAQTVAHRAIGPSSTAGRLQCLEAPAVATARTVASHPSKGRQCAWVRSGWPACGRNSGRRRQRNLRCRALLQLLLVQQYVMHHDLTCLAHAPRHVLLQASHVSTRKFPRRATGR